MDNVIILQVAPEIRGLIQDCGWRIETVADNVVVFSKSVYTISLSAFNRKQEYVKIYDRDQVYTKREIRFIEITNIMCSERYSDEYQLHRILKNLSDISDKNSITLYININKTYDSYEAFQGFISDYNELDFSLIIKNRLPYCVRFHKNEKYLFLPLSPDLIPSIMELSDKLMLYANSPTIKYAYSVIIDDVFSLLSLNKRTYKDAIIIEDTLESLRQFLQEDFESYGLYKSELDEIDRILSSIRKSKSIIL